MIDHLLLGCVLSRQVWTSITNAWGRPSWMSVVDATLVGWWTSLSPREQLRKETWTMVTLVAWMLWKHRNNIVFIGASPSADAMLRKI